MEEPSVNVSAADRGDKTMEELEASMSTEGLDLVEKLKESTIANVLKNAKAERKFRRRNRVAWDRMNRPAKLESINRGMQKIFNLIDGKGPVLDPVEPVKPEEA